MTAKAANSVFKIKLSDRVTYDGCADLLAFLAYPVNEKKRELFARALRFALVQEMGNRYPDWLADIPASRYVPKPFENIDRIFVVGCKLIEGRMTAAKTGRVYLRAAIAAKNKKKSEMTEGKAVSLQESFSRVEEQHGEPKRRHQATLWKQSLSLIHLAIAFDELYVLRSTARKSELSACWEKTLSIDPAEWIAIAEEIRLVLVKSQATSNSRGIGAWPKFKSKLTKVGAL